MSGPHAQGIGEAARFRRRRAEPRADELRLIRECLDAPRTLSSGPVGRCTKHGWLRSVIESTGTGKGSTTVVRYEVTDAGREAVAAASRER